VSAANIAQLAADLLIASLSLHLVGVFDSRDLVPVVGGREDGEEGVSTPLEREPTTPPFTFPSLEFLRTQGRFPSAVFGKEGCDVVVIQQRSPVLVVRFPPPRRIPSPPDPSTF
jgi:proteasome assembly chaperone 2